MREKFIEQLEQLNQALAEMGKMVGDAIHNAMTALQDLDKEKATKIIDGDNAIDQKEKEIESLCLHIMLQQAPIASDFRQVSSALKMITDLERIGDHATDISEIIILLNQVESVPLMEKIQEMAQLVMVMVSESIKAYAKQDKEAARKVIEKDDLVDALFVEVKSRIAKSIDKDEESTMQALDLLMIAKYLERIGDHAENIAEWVVFAITGKHKDERVI